jgi:hypothetical protein
MAAVVERESKSRRSPSLSGIGSILVFFASAAFTAAGVATALGYSARPSVVGWLSLIPSVGVGVWSIKYWARILPGILGCATLNGRIVTTSGHALNHPSVPIDRLTATLVTLGLGLSTVLATTFKNRPLTIVDRIACLGIFACFAIILSPSKQQMLGLVGIVVCTVVAWAVERRRHVHHHAASGTA